MKKKNTLAIIVLTFILCSCGNNEFPRNTEVIQLIKEVNNHWQSNNPHHGSSFWHNAAYHTGNLAAYEVTQDTNYLNYSVAWADFNKWSGATSNDTSEWVYDYGESEEFVLFGDWQICFQVYCDLYKIEPNDYKIDRARQVMEYQMRTSKDNYLWWIDGLYMVMPVMTRLYSITQNELYLSKLYEYFSYSRNLLYDKESGLFYRDAKYVYPDHKTNNGLKDFWSRGNGWVFAAIPRVLDDLPENDPHRDEYISIYKNMAATLSVMQQPGGYWTRSLMDHEQAPGPETSGTAFFIYAYLWGINNGILEYETYKETIIKGWEYLSETALQADGSIGYIQPIGERAIPGQVVSESSTADFGVGAFLLAASEMVKFCID